MTPEGRVKAKVTKLLKEYGVYTYMPVPGGFGKPGLDYHCCHHGYALFIETKAPGGVPTARQGNTIDEIRAADGYAIVVRDDIDLDMLRQWLVSTCKLSACTMHPLKPRENEEVVEYNGE